MFLCGGFMKSILNKHISEVNAEKWNNLSIPVSGS